MVVAGVYRRVCDVFAILQEVAQYLHLRAQSDWPEIKQTSLLRQFSRCAFVVTLRHQEATFIFVRRENNFR